MSLPLTAVKLIKVSPRCNIPVASAPWDYWRVTIIQSNEPLIPSITVNERRQSALFQTGRHTHRGRERSEMSIGTCWIPQVSQCAAVCMGARLILRLYAKFALSNAQRRGPRPHNPPDPPPPIGTRAHTRARSKVDVFEEAADRTRSDVRANLWMLWQQPTRVTNIARFFSSNILFDRMTGSHQSLASENRLNAYDPVYKSEEL